MADVVVISGDTVRRSERRAVFARLDYRRKWVIFFFLWSFVVIDVYQLLAFYEENLRWDNNVVNGH